ncbi:hypothetical protein [Parasitella parasitica]|uniref:Galactose oxidase n=1 Tax=Parasitella parasitica TaxID=35722 RepID=A0A0B7NUA7_9FUNG|nr:hypothetical protein [Parasitella parasitica]
MAGTATSISDSQYIEDGGYNESPFVKNVSRLFDANSAKWTTIPNDNRGLESAIYMGTAVSVPSRKRIYYWGGLSICPGVLPLGVVTRFGHTATLDKEGINIFYIGGRIRTNKVANDTQPTSYYNIIPMNEILTYNTFDATWNLRNSPSAPTMSSRYMHTANLLPYSGKILIYGGATDDGNEKQPSAVSDYLYLFDSKTLEYARVDDSEQNQGAGPRFGHSATQLAVLCNNTLFVLFGVNAKGLITNDMYFLSLSGSATWLKSFKLSSASAGGDDSNTFNTHNTLNDRAIIGISIGSVLVIVLLITGILYAIYNIKSRKRKLAAAAAAAAEEEKTNNDDDVYGVPQQYLPHLHKEYQRYSSVDAANPPNEYDHVTTTPDGALPVFDISSDSATLHDSSIPPRGFSNDHIITSKPNQVNKPQQQPSFTSQQQHSSGSLHLLPSSNLSNTPIAAAKLPFNDVVKPSAI